jgi:hypothetical protein
MKSAPCSHILNQSDDGMIAGAIYLTATGNAKFVIRNH